MAPAITHFLVGAALLLLIATPIVLRYDIDREHAIWLIPLGGVWGLLPDVHHIAPVYTTELYAFHNSPWADLFALHYTLDRPAIRARYLESVFGSIGLFIGAVAVFWMAQRVRDAAVTARTTTERLFVKIVATGTSAGFATLGLGVVVSIQGAFPAVAALVGSGSLLVGGLLLIPLGTVGAVLVTIGLELFAQNVLDDPLATALVGGGVGLVGWLGGVVLLVPLWIGAIAPVSVSIPFFHWGSLVALVIHATVCGAVYSLTRGALTDAEKETTQISTA